MKHMHSSPQLHCFAFPGGAWAAHDGGGGAGRRGHWAHHGTATAERSQDSLTPAGVGRHIVFYFLSLTWQVGWPVGGLVG